MRSFDLQPTLIGKLVGLRPLKIDDFEALYIVASDPSLWEQHPAPDRYQRPVFEEFFRESLECGGALVAFEPSTHEIVGSSRFYDLSLDLNQVVIGYSFLAKKFWGLGLNREMKQLMLDHVFKSLKLALFHVDEKNIRSQRALERIGITKKERIEKFRQRPDGSWRSSLVYRVERH